MKSVLVDYGAGNIHSVHKALLRSGLDVTVSHDPAQAEEAAALILPGQGHFGQVMRSFRDSGFEPLVRRHIESGRPFLGICVGLQLLLEGSEEAPRVAGLGILPGTVKRFPAGSTVPQMGWNSLHKHGDSPLLEGVEDGSYVYYANSYYADLEIDGSVPAMSGAYTTYGGVRFLGALSRGTLHATQFHPEKSQRVGLAILANFSRLVRAGAPEAA
ncbi:MAG TPA: imidazole glycerol phosphate synthase subunit HisH [Trueperaceae bacterium]